MKSSWLKRALRPIANRMRLCRLVRALQLGLLLALVSIALWIAASFAMPIEALFWKSGLTALVLLAAPVLCALMWPVRMRDAARAADALGLDERALTALTVRGDGAMHQLQREDAKTKLASLDVRAGMRPRANRRELTACGALALLTFILLFVPNPQQDALDRMRAFEKKMDQLAMAAEQRASVDAEAEQTKQQTPELRKLERELLEQIRKARSERAAYEAIDAAEQKLNRMAKDVSEGSTKAGADGDGQPGQGEADTPSDVGEEQETEAMAQANASTANQTPGGAAQPVTSAQLQKMNALLDQLRQGVNKAAASSSGQGQGPGEGNGKGQGQGDQSQRQGEESGTGAGRGTTNKDEGKGGDMRNINSPPGSATAEHRVGQYESIYDPTRIDGTDDLQQAKGELGEGEISRMQLGPGRGQLSGDVPYNRVIGDYAPQAAQAADDAQLPPAVRQWVNDYFDALID